MMERPARKRFGQNFLHDPGTIRRILAAIDPRPGERLVEVGPGRGALTGALLAAGGRLDVIELDRDLIGPLAERFMDAGALRIHNADALTFDLCALCGASERLRLIGNLPYNISTPLLFRFLQQAACLVDLHLMLQREVVDRILAAPGSKTYGRLSVMVQQRCRGELIIKVAPGAFSPPPRVESAMVALYPDDPPPHTVNDPRWFAELVKRAFAQRRKTLRNALKGLVSDAELELCGIAPDARAEQVPVALYALLANRTVAE